MDKRKKMLMELEAQRIKSMNKRAANKLAKRAAGDRPSMAAPKGHRDHVSNFKKNKDGSFTRISAPKTKFAKPTQKKKLMKGGGNVVKTYSSGGYVEGK
jgi:hypothetical protein